MDDSILVIAIFFVIIFVVLIPIIIINSKKQQERIRKQNIEAKERENLFISEIKKSIEFIENDFFEEIVFHKPKNCWVEVLNYRNIKMGKEVIYEPENEILSIEYNTRYCSTRILNITRSEKCLVKWAVHICRDDVRNLKDNTFLGCIYVGENNIERYYEEKARKKVIEKHRKKELEKKALLDLIDEGVIYDKEEDIELKHLHQIRRKRNSRT